jgi:hypothetical protein
MLARCAGQRSTKAMRWENGSAEFEIIFPRYEACDGE